MNRGGALKLEAGPSGALGISRETSVCVGKERRDTTKAPPGEMFIAVANSRESRPLPSRDLTKTGMARSNRAHLRCSFCDTLSGTYEPTLFSVLLAQVPHLRGQSQVYR